MNGMNIADKYRFKIRFPGVLMQMLKKALAASWLGAALWLAAPQPAHAILITFEGLKDFEQVTNQYFADGVTFNNATAAVAPPDGTLNEIDFPPTSGTTLVTNETFSTGDFAPSGLGDISFNFNSVYYNTVSGYFTYGDYGLSGDPLSVSVYSPSDLINPLTVLTVLENLGSPQFLQFTGLGPIAALIARGGTGSYFTLDDLEFTDPETPVGTVVPEPGTLLLVSLGGFGLVSRRFKK